MAKRRSGNLGRIDQALGEAGNFDQWLESAREHDELSGADAWRGDDASRLYDAENIRLRLKRLRRAISLTPARNGAWS